MANTPTFALAGKHGSLTLFTGVPGLRLTKWGLHGKGDTIDVTNTRSPAVPLGVTNQSTQVVSEWIGSVLDMELTFEGVFTILDASPSTYNHLLSLTSGVPGMIPGTSSADSYGRAAFVLIPDTAHYNTDTVAGNVVLESFDVDGEIRGGVLFKGSGKVSGLMTMGTNL